MKNYISLALFAGAIPTIAIFQNPFLWKINSAVSLVSLHGDHLEDCFSYFCNATWLSAAAIGLILFCFSAICFFFYKGVKRLKKANLSTQENALEPIEEEKHTAEEPATHIQKDINDAEWERFREMTFSSYPHLQEALDACAQSLPPIEVYIACLIYIEISEKDICTFLNIDQDALAMHQLHLRKGLNVPANQSLEYYIQQKNESQ